MRKSRRPIRAEGRSASHRRRSQSVAGRDSNRAGGRVHGFRSRVAVCRRRKRLVFSRSTVGEYIRQNSLRDRFGPYPPPAFSQQAPGLRRALFVNRPPAGARRAPGWPTITARCAAARGGRVTGRRLRGCVRASARARPGRALAGVVVSRAARSRLPWQPRRRAPSLALRLKVGGGCGSSRGRSCRERGSRSRPGS